MKKKSKPWKIDAPTPKIIGEVYIRPTLFASENKYPVQPFQEPQALKGAIGEFRGYYQAYKKVNPDRWNPWASQFGFNRSGGGKLHSGIDIYAPGGPHPKRQPVYASVAGTAYVYHWNGGLGESVVIRFQAGGETYQIYYSHLDRTVIGAGTITEKQVRDGLIVGYAGYSGNGDDSPVCETDGFAGFDSGHVHVLIENRSRRERYDPAKMLGWTLNYVGKSSAIYCKDLKKLEKPEKTPTVGAANTITAKHITIAQDTLTSKLGLPDPLSLSHGGADVVCAVADAYRELEDMYKVPTATNLPDREKLRADFRARVKADLARETAIMNRLKTSTEKQDALRFITHTNNAIKLLIGIGAIATLPFSAPLAVALSMGGLIYSVSADSLVTAFQISRNKDISTGEAFYSLMVGDGSGLLATIGREAGAEAATIAGRKMLSGTIGVLGSVADIHNAAASSLAFRRETLDLSEKMKATHKEMSDLEALVMAEVYNDDEAIDDAIQELARVSATVLGEWCKKLKDKPGLSPATLMMIEGIPRRGPTISAG